MYWTPDRSRADPAVLRSVVRWAGEDEFLDVLRIGLLHHAPREASTDVNAERTHCLFHARHGGGVHAEAAHAEPDEKWCQPRIRRHLATQGYRHAHAQSGFGC